MALRDDLLDPIRGDNPSGQNLRYDPITDKIKEARREDDPDLPQRDWKTALKTADYPAVIKLAGEAIAKRSKDLQLAVWLIDAHVRRERFPVLGQCFGFLHDLLSDFWDTLYPEIEDDDLDLRIAPLEWLGTKLEEPLRQLPITSAGYNYHHFKESRLVGYEAEADTEAKMEAREKKIKDGKLTADAFDEAVDNTPKSFYEESLEQIGLAQTELEGLIEFCDSKFGDGGPSFLKTRAALEEIHDVLSSLLTKKGGADQPVAAATKVKVDEDEFSAFLSASAPDPFEETASADDTVDLTASESDLNAELDTEAGGESAGAGAAARRARSAVSYDSAEFGELDDIAGQLAAISRALRKKDTDDPSPYMLIRGYRWGELWWGVPPVREHILEAPSTEIRMRLRRTYAEGQWDQLLDATETAMAMPCGRGWLDIQFMAVTALEARNRMPIAFAICSSVKALVRDIPKLPDMVLTDGTPTASAETKQWIDSLLNPPPPPEKPASTDSDSSDSDSSSSSDDFSFDSSASTDTEASTDTSSDFSFDSSSSTDTDADSLSSAPVADEPTTFELEQTPPILEAEDVFPPEIPGDEFDQASVAVRNGDVPEGLRLISEKLAMERTGRGRFRRRTQIAHLLMIGGHAKIAAPLLDELATQIDQLRLEEWEEPGAVAYPLELLVKCIGSRPDQADRKTQLYTRLCRIDPVRAMNCTP